MKLRILANKRAEGSRNVSRQVSLDDESDVESSDHNVDGMSSDQPVDDIGSDLTSTFRVWSAE